MATALATNDVLRIVSWCQMGAQAMLNTGHFRVTATVGGPTLEGLVENMADVWKDVYKGWLTSAAKFRGIEGRRISAVASYTVNSTDANTAGEAGDNPLPSFATGVISVGTAGSGARYRGRRFIGFGDESKTDDAFNVNLAGRVILATIADLWTTIATYGGADTVTLKGVLVPNGVVADVRDIDRAYVRTYMTTQRRRGTLSKPNTSPWGA